MFREYVSDNEGKPIGTAGVGLGLTICKGLVAAHGGCIRAASGGPGQFWLRRQAYFDLDQERRRQRAA